ncbi:MAG: AMP-binding protein [Alphaproteobacteria bacterium]|nr:AMP-binding protein [Alphaproteobacteria bacterium]
MDLQTERPASYRAVTIAEGIRTAAARDPDRPALTEERRSTTFRQLLARINRVSNTVMGLGLRKGDHSAIMAPNCSEYLEVTVGSAEAGVAPAMVNPRATATELGYICNDAGARVLFVHKDAEAVARSADLKTVERIVIIDRNGSGPDDYETLIAQGKDTAPSVALEEWDVFSVPYTSGTTGQPKGVMLSHRSRVNHMLFTMAANYGCYTPDARGLAMSPFFTGAGFINALAPAFFGGTTHILPRYEPEAMLKAVNEQRISSMFMVPTHFHAMFSLGAEKLRHYDLKSLKVIHSNAAPLPQATKERIVEFFGDNILFESYGSTETGSCTTLRPRDQLRKHQCVGQPNVGVWLELRDEAGALVPPGIVGEVWVKNAWLFNGYWNKPAETAEAYRNGWVSVGDLGRLDEEGYLYLVDRKKNVIISGGQNIFPREIEERLHHHPAVLEAAIVGKKDDYWGEAVNAFVVLRPGAHPTADELKTFCAETLSRYKLPKNFHFVDALPRNAAGKILHRELRDRLNRS